MTETSGVRRDPPTMPLPVQEAVRRRRRGRRAWLVVLIVLVVLAVLAVVAFFVGDRIFRANAEAQIERSVEQNLPNGVTGSVDATVGGGSALLQYLHGSFDDVTLTSSDLRVAGAPASARIRVAGLPVDGGRIDRATGTISVGQAAFRTVPALRNVGATAPRLGDGTVSTTLTRKFLGIDVKVAVALKPALDDQTVRLSPTSASLTAGPATIPATAIVQQLLPDGVSVCAASYLPRGIELTSVRIRPGQAVAGLAARDVDLNALGSAETGSCR
ncbi:LmeA family phospholipid-binding protein [Amnibacterium setariae]|uniref:DUF2993 domain-containing protein n=1 Tax=Amnibacterium setariae TaxID=2306585 RepID=A0A3A1U453_9MICO|nr:DUF2993 domain-containing protein [Amnibacterium setariae]RIX31100.1 DUF2993 domain-containing protein [Amnibacterium setariae]